jgi:hypothetical protein
VRRSVAVIARRGSGVRGMRSSWGP